MTNIRYGTRYSLGRKILKRFPALVFRVFGMVRLVRVFRVFRGFRVVGVVGVVYVLLMIHGSYMPIYIWVFGTPNFRKGGM